MKKGIEMLEAIKRLWILLTCRHVNVRSPYGMPEVDVCVDCGHVSIFVEPVCDFTEVCDRTGLSLEQLATDITAN